MKKAVIISSSPRKGGNSDLLCDEFLKGALEAGHQAEKIFLADKKINYCTGCGSCVSRKGKCSQHDDMQGIMEKLVEADVIAMATPVYFYTMSGQMKTFIDRLCPVYTLMEGKDFYFIATAAEGAKSALDGTIDGFRLFTSCLPGPDEKGIIYGTGVWEKGEIQGSKAMEEAYQMGRAI